MGSIGIRLFAATGSPAAARAKKTPLVSGTWLWLAISLVLHGLVVLSLGYAGIFPCPASEPPPETVVELNLGSLAGPGGAGGDGQVPGGGNGISAGDVAPQPLPPSPALPAASPAQDTDPLQSEIVAPQPALESVPSLETTRPEPWPKPEPEVHAPPKVAAQPKPPAKPRHAPKHDAAPKRPAQQDLAPQAPPPVAMADPVSGGQGQGVGAGGEGVAPGTGGSGPGKGIGAGPGPGGDGVKGPGGGGGGDYVGQFGRGDGPTFRHRTLPQYPSEAMRDGQEGKVVLRLSIDADGVLRDAEVIRHNGLEFAEAALRAVRTSSYFPAKRNGVAVPCRALLGIRFKMD